MKGWMQSKTMWINGAIATVGFLQGFDLASVVPQAYLGYTMLALGVINIWLRILTKMPVSKRPVA